MIDKIIDTSGLSCPLPILKTKNALSTMSANQILKLISTDEGSISDIGAFCKQTGNELILQTKEASKCIFIIKKA